MINLDARTMARLLGGDVTGPHSVLCPGPYHSPKDRSLSVKLKSEARGGILVHSFANDDWRMCREFVRAKLKLTTWHGVFLPHPPSCTTKPALLDAAQMGQMALRIFAESSSLDDTIGEKYLERRIHHTLVWPADVRFHAHCARKIGTAVEHHAALVALLRDVRTNEPRAIQRVFLKPDGSDRLRDPMGKMSLGPTRGACIKLSTDAAVTHGLGLAEGIETGLALMACGWQPIWSTAGSAGLGAFPVIDGIEALTVLADNDENGSGEIAALECVKRWRAAGREAKAIKPHYAGHDWNDVLGAVT
jgi:hypothetical protein